MQKSLNIVTRKNDYNRIQHENAKLLERIVHKKGTMSKHAHDETYKEHKRMIKLLQNKDSIPCAFYRQKRPSMANDGEMSRRSVQLGAESTGKLANARDRLVSGGT